MRHLASLNQDSRNRWILGPALLTVLALAAGAAMPALAGGSHPGNGELAVPVDDDEYSTPVGFIDLDLLKFHTDCITQPPPPDPIGPVVTLFAYDFDGDRREEVGGYDVAACEMIQPTDLCDVLTEDQDPVSWNVLSGDWNGDGRDTLAVYDLETCETSPVEDAAPETLILPEDGSWQFLIGDWEGRGESSILMARPVSEDGTSCAGLFGGRFDGVNDSIATVDGEGGTIVFDIDGPLTEALESYEIPWPGPGALCLDFAIQCWEINVGGLHHTLCLRRRCCLGEGCTEYLGGTNPS